MTYHPSTKRKNWPKIFSKIK